jgi:hypothetical protein
MKKPSLFFTLSVSFLVHLACMLNAAPTDYFLADKDPAVHQKVFEKLRSQNSSLSANSPEELVALLQNGSTFIFTEEGKKANCPDCLGFGRVSKSQTRTADGKEPCTTCDASGKVIAPGPEYRIRWNNTTAAKPAEVDPRLASLSRSSTKKPADYSALKQGKISLKARLLKSGVEMNKSKGYWGWARYSEHFREMEIEVHNVSQKPTPVRVEIIMIGNDRGKSGGVFAAGVTTKDLDLSAGDFSKFTAEAITQSMRWSTYYSEGASGTLIEGYVIRTIEKVDGEDRITTYHTSMPHLEKFVSIDATTIKNDGSVKLTE